MSIFKDVPSTVVGMTNYRIDRIGTHRHASTLNLTTSTWQNRGRGMKVQFHGMNILETETVPVPVKVAC